MSNRHDYNECNNLLWAIFALNIGIIGSGSLFTTISAALQLVCILLLWHYLKKLKE